ncbi:MAG: hypothetical protein AB7G15_08465 [Alphaproteobacteria bacterium]
MLAALMGSAIKFNGVVDVIFGLRNAVEDATASSDTTKNAESILENAVEEFLEVIAVR